MGSLRHQAQQTRRDGACSASSPAGGFPLSNPSAARALPPPHDMPSLTPSCSAFRASPATSSCDACTLSAEGPNQGTACGGSMQQQHPAAAVSRLPGRPGAPVCAACMHERGRPGSEHGPASAAQQPALTGSAVGEGKAGVGSTTLTMVTSHPGSRDICAAAHSTASSAGGGRRHRRAWMQQRQQAGACEQRSYNNIVAHPRWARSRPRRPACAATAPPSSSAETQKRAPHRALAMHATEAWREG
jgi:hypothetical protein